MTLGRRATQFFLFVIVMAVCAFVASLIAQAAPHGDGTDMHRGFLASTRTAMLALSAALLAWGSRRTRFGDLSWLVYTILVLGAVKLAAEDIAAGGAASLFVSLGMYGGALILGPRFLHHRGRGEAPHTPA
jgi:hypothetical protein